MQKAPILLATRLSPMIEAQWQENLQAIMPEENILSLNQIHDRRGIEIALVANPPSGILGDFPDLKWIQSLWAGVENLLTDKTLPKIPICRLIDPDLAQAMAETVTAAVMAFHRDFDLYQSQQQQKLWRQHPPVSTRERSVTILGLGEMGRVSAAMLASLGFSVHGWSRSPKNLQDITCYHGEEGLRRSVDQANILVNLLPLTEQTRAILNRDIFQLLAPDACLINFGRGGHLVEAELLDYLEQDKIRHAFLDVFVQEPLPTEHPFWSHPKITVFPHIAATTNPVSASKVIAQNIRHYRQTGVIPVSCNRVLGY
ncbi:2-hydroxyacid dehydrogenase [Zymomonas mobilis]|uniref:2-hydroxyacid dehydrogenase n=1 Tax=Zymomonas mobilis TaxID=542 RepID=UPI0021C38665|nr:glyoxylate/hydroxypyruvate reductase A [Zymomonas mobilis]MCP9308367.1 glyoxylate/hydroxypyruvate reductase A [Zymomonas mobilis]